MVRVDKTIDHMIDRIVSKTHASAVQIKTIDKTHVLLIASFYSNKPSITYTGDLSAKTLKRGA